jgi:hypothetical protein
MNLTAFVSIDHQASWHETLEPLANDALLYTTRHTGKIYPPSRHLSACSFLPGSISNTGIWREFKRGLLLLLYGPYIAGFSFSSCRRHELVHHVISTYRQHHQEGPASSDHEQVISILVEAQQRRRPRLEKFMQLHSPFLSSFYPILSTQSPSDFFPFFLFWYATSFIISLIIRHSRSGGD